MESGAGLMTKIESKRRPGPSLPPYRQSVVSAPALGDRDRASAPQALHGVEVAHAVGAGVGDLGPDAQTGLCGRT